MNKTINLSLSKRVANLSFWIVATALGAGLALSFFSWLEICVEHCSANKDFRLLGLPFAYVGMAFFLALFSSHLLSWNYEWLSRPVGWMIASSLGAEGVFIAVQKNQIGHWCPVCLSIAATLLIAAVAFFGNRLYYNVKDHQQGDPMIKKIKIALESVSFVVIGFIIAFMGVSKIDPLQANTDKMRDKLEMGNTTAPIEVYFVTDWFCPSCKKVEPLIEKLYPKIQSKVGFFFVDFPIHAKSMNFSPYNLAFLINDKPQYFAARKMLMHLAEETEDPTDEDIEKASRKAGLKLKELSYLDVKGGMENFNKIVQKYKLDSTPTLIILNTKTTKFTKLEGTDEINEASVIKAIDALEKHAS